MPNTVDILEGLIKGADRAASNLYNISQARAKSKQDDERWQIEKKQMKLDVEKLQYEGSPEQRALADKTTKAKIKDIESSRDVREQTLDLAESKFALEKKDHETGMQILRTQHPELFRDTGDATDLGSSGGGDVAASINPEMYEPRGLAEGESIDIGPYKRKGVAERRLTPEQERRSGNEKQNAIETLKQGQWVDEDGNPQKLTSKEDATDFIMTEFDVDISDPEIQAALGQYKPTGDAIDEPGFFEKYFLGQKFPQKEKYGWLWEKKEDGEWHKVEEIEAKPEEE